MELAIGIVIGLLISPLALAVRIAHKIGKKYPNGATEEQIKAHFSEAVDKALVKTLAKQ